MNCIESLYHPSQTLPSKPYIKEDESAFNSQLSKLSKKTSPNVLSPLPRRLQPLPPHTTTESIQKSFVRSYPIPVSPQSLLAHSLLQKVSDTFSTTHSYEHPTSIQTPRPPANIVLHQKIVALQKKFCALQINDEDDEKTGFLPILSQDTSEPQLLQDVTCVRQMRRCPKGKTLPLLILPQNPSDSRQHGQHKKSPLPDLELSLMKKKASLKSHSLQQSFSEGSLNSARASLSSTTSRSTSSDSARPIQAFEEEESTLKKKR